VENRRYHSSGAVRTILQEIMQQQELRCRTLPSQRISTSTNISVSIVLACK
jgi:hypothetical protein